MKINICCRFQSIVQINPYMLEFYQIKIFQINKIFILPLCSILNARTEWNCELALKLKVHSWIIYPVTNFFPFFGFI